MNKFRFWVADDLLHNSIESALQSALGAHNSFAIYKVFANPSDPIEECEKATSRDDLPDVALIDVSFASASARGLVANVHESVRGFVVASELKHYAEDLGKHDWVYRLYTADDNVKTNFECLYNNPYGHEPLLPISIKGKVVQGFDFIEWVRQECHELVKKRLLYAEEDLTELSALVDEAKLNITGLWSTKWKDCRDDFDKRIRPETEKLIQKFYDALRRNPKTAESNLLAVERLRKARTCGAIDFALFQSDGEIVRELSLELKSRTRDFVDTHATLISETLRHVSRIAEDFVENEKFGKYLGPLFPFEACEIKESSDPETIVRALRQILDLLGTIDHTYTLARAFKSLKVPNRAEPLPTTVFAAACHDWQERDWLYDFPIPATSHEKEILLEEELNEKAVLEQNRVVPLLKLPDETLKRIRADGKQATGGIRDSLLAFTRSTKVKEEWEKSPSSCLQEKFSGIEVAVTSSGSELERVLWDWRHFFGVNDGPNAGVIDRICSEVSARGVRSAEIDYTSNPGAVRITLDFEVERHLEQIDLRKPGGGLSKALRAFLGWGHVTIYTNNTLVCFRTSWPGGDLETVSGNPSQPLFKLEWIIPHYLETRTGP